MALKISTKFFQSIKSNVKIVKISYKYYFDIFDLSVGLDYNNQKYLHNYYVEKCNDVKIHFNKYIDTNSVRAILNRSRKPNAKKLLQEILEFTNSNFQIILPNRFEEDIFNSIKDFLSDNDDIQVLSNKRIETKYPDIIINKINCTESKTILIIEINEHDHPINLERMELIKLKLKCKNFLNVNPHDKKFSTGKLLKTINKLI